MAMKDPTKPDGEHKNGAAPDYSVMADENRRLREQLAARDEELAARDDQLADMAQAMPTPPLPEHLQPLWEILGPGTFFSQDCVSYPPGSIVRDTYGLIVPNEEMLALNPPAEERMDAYLATLPGGGTPSLDLILESAFEMRPRDGDSPEATAAFHAKVLEAALLKKYRQEGRIPPAPGERLQPQRPKRPTRPDPNTPIMSNTRIKSLNLGDAFSPASRLFAEPLPQRAATTQRVR